MSNKDRNYMRVGPIFEKDGMIYVVYEPLKTNGQC